MPTINGQKGAFPQPGHFGRSEAGAYTVKIFEGTMAEIYQIAGIVELSGGLWEVTESYTGAKHRMECRFPIDFNTTEAPVDGWEFFATDVEKDVLQSDIAIIEAIDNHQKKIIRKALATFDTSGDDPSDPDAIPDGLTDPNAIELYKEMISGLQSVRVPVPTLRHTQTVSTLWSVRAALTNVTKIISTNSLISLESLPTSVLFNLPTNASTRIAAAYGWYKKYPTVRIAAGHRIQIEQEWEYGHWSKIIYMGGISGAPI